VPRYKDASAVWFVDDKPEAARDFADWKAAVEWCEGVRIRLQGEGWSEI